MLMPGDVQYLCHNMRLEVPRLAFEYATQLTLNFLQIWAENFISFLLFLNRVNTFSN